MRRAPSPLAGFDFDLPPDREAMVPPEHRGLARDRVRLLVARPQAIAHTTFRHIGDHLASGDLVVVNTSPTMPAALPGRLASGHRQRRVVVHLSTRHDDTWEVEVRLPDGTGPVLDAGPGDVVTLQPAGTIRLLAAADDRPDGVRLWHATVDTPTSIASHLQAHGRPITYAHSPARFPLALRQTVFARLGRSRSQDPVRGGASAEMASAGRPFTPTLVTDLVRRGVTLAPITLHAGVSSLEADEPPRAEAFDVPVATADLVNRARARGGRVVATGTTVARALETVASPDGTVVPSRGWTELVLGPDRPARAVDGLITGWHAPQASHLLLLEAVAGRRLVAEAYESALATDYLWHEFGDSCLLLP